MPYSPLHIIAVVLLTEFGLLVAGGYGCEKIKIGPHPNPNLNPQPTRFHAVIILGRNKLLDCEGRDLEQKGKRWKERCCFSSCIR